MKIVPEEITPNYAIENETIIGLSTYHLEYVRGILMSKVSKNVLCEGDAIQWWMNAFDVAVMGQDVEMMEDILAYDAKVSGMEVDRDSYIEGGMFVAFLYDKPLSLKCILSYYQKNSNRMGLIYTHYIQHGRPSIEIIKVLTDFGLMPKRVKALDVFHLFYNVWQFPVHPMNASEWDDTTKEFLTFMFKNYKLVGTYPGCIEECKDEECFICSLIN